eukprot:2689643-Rhodomonas_salina.4
MRYAGAAPISVLLDQYWISVLARSVHRIAEHQEVPEVCDWVQLQKFLPRCSFCVAPYPPSVPHVTQQIRSLGQYRTSHSRSVGCQFFCVAASRVSVPDMAERGTTCEEVGVQEDDDVQVTHAPQRAPARTSSQF